MANFKSVRPSVEAIVGEYMAQPWLLELARELAASQSLLHRVAAAGVLARLTVPPKVLIQDAIKHLLDGEPGPNQRAHAWFDGLPSDVRDEAVSVALGAIQLLEEELEAFDEAVIAGDPVGKERGMRLLRSRDTLECVAELVDPHANGAIRHSLDQFDELAEGGFAFLEKVGVDEEERLCAVFWISPEAWWGRLMQRHMPKL